MPTIIGTPGDDNFLVSTNFAGTLEDDLIDGGAGGDRIFGNAGNDVLVGGGGDDLFFPGVGRIRASSALTTIALDGAFDGADTIDGGPGLDAIGYAYPADGAPVVVDLTAGTGRGGNAEGDRYTNIEGVQVVAVDFVGRSTLVGNGLDNILFGGEGEDRLDGRAGSDFLAGDTGNDTYVGSAGNDVISDDLGQDRIESSLLLVSSIRQGDDLELTFGSLVFGGRPTVLSRITVEDHFVEGGAVEELVDPTTGEVLVLATGLVGGSASGILSGTTAAETLDGGGGDDLLFGAHGADVLIGGEDDDTLFGGKGPDLFVVGVGDGRDVIVDFKLNGRSADRLDLSAFGFAGPEDALAGLADGPDGAVLDLGGGQTVTLAGVRAVDLGPEHLVLAAEA
jgi:Ca2+-binding RTX toxin-like protein